MLTVADDAGRGESRAHAFGDAGGIGQRAGHERDEFLAAEPADDVVRAHGLAHHLREHLQNGIADGMSKAVVDRFEMIEIEGEHADRRVAVSAARP